MDLNKTPRLLVMMFIQYFMQGARNMTMGLVLSTYGMANHYWLILCLAWSGDHSFSTLYWYGGRPFFLVTKVMALLHLINAAVLLFVPQFIEAQNTGMTLTMIFPSRSVVLSNNCAG